MADHTREREHTRVVIVDDHQVIRAGIRFALFAVDDIEVVGEAADGEEALRVCEKLRPDVVIMDLKLPGLDGISATRELHRRHPEIRVLALTSYRDDELVPQALQAGALSYLIKDVELDDLIDAIRATRNGQSRLSEEATKSLIHAMTNSAWSQQAALRRRLTVREREVLVLVAKGLDNQDIADQLVITVATVKYHMHQLFDKLGVTSRTELVALALHYQLVT